METLTALKAAHMVATVVLLACALGLGIWVLLARRKGCLLYTSDAADE